MTTERFEVKAWCQNTIASWLKNKIYSFKGRLDWWYWALFWWSLNQVRSTTATECHKQSESFALKCTTKGKKEGSGGKIVKVLSLPMVMTQFYVSNMKSSWQDKLVHFEKTLKMAGTFGGNYFRRMETLFRILWKQRTVCLILLFECFQFHLEVQILPQLKPFSIWWKNNWIEIHLNRT